MPGEKFIQHDAAGSFREVEATQTGGAGNEDRIAALGPSGRLDISMMPTGIGADTENLIASESLAAGDFINLFDSAGAGNVRKADATNGLEAHGFVKQAAAAGAPAIVFFEGNNDQVTGQTPGVVFLSTSAGLATSTAPSATGQIVQRLGVATSATNINFERTNKITLA